MINQKLDNLMNKESPENFLEIVTCIVNYYSFSEVDESESGDEWKKLKCGLQKDPIPRDLDKMIKQGFKKLLKKYCK